MAVDLPVRSVEGALPAEITPARRLSPWRRYGLLRQILQCLLVALVAFGSYFLISRYFLQSVRVSGASMQPTLRNAQHCFLNRWVLHFRAPRHGDVVVLRDPSDGALAVKRVVAVEGDSLRVTHSGEVYLNNELLKEPYLPKGSRTFPGPTSREQSFRCEPGQYVVFGDNRMNSSDSRNYGPVLRKNILGLIIR